MTTRFCWNSGLSVSERDRRSIYKKVVPRVIEGHEFRTEYQFIKCPRCGRELRVTHHPSSIHLRTYPRHKGAA